MIRIMKKTFKKSKSTIILSLLLFLTIVTAVLSTSCSNTPQVLIYTSAEDYRIEYMRERLKNEFPHLNIVIEYMPTGNHAAKLLAEGKSTECDITYDLEYTYLDKLEKAGILADLSEYDFSIFSE